MIETVTQSIFINAFRNSEEFKEKYSYEALGDLFTHLEQYEDETGEQIELNIYTLQGLYSEFDSLDKFNEDRFPTRMGFTVEDDWFESVDKLRESTEVIEVGNTGRIIIMTDFQEARADCLAFRQSQRVAQMSDRK